MGALLRWAVSEFVYNWAGTGFPWGTLAVNVAGSFVIGILWGMTFRFTIPQSLAALLFIGVLGAFTTFSTFSLETINLAREGQAGTALLNVLAQNILGVAMAALGYFLSRGIVELTTSQ